MDSQVSILLLQDPEAGQQCEGSHSGWSIEQPQGVGMVGIVGIAGIVWMVGIVGMAGISYKKLKEQKNRYWA